MGSIQEPKYSVTGETHKILDDGILQNSLVPSLPQEIKEAARHVKYEANNDKPSIPINWRFAESISALKGFEAAMLSVLRRKKYGSKYADIKINTDHASLFVMTPMIMSVVQDDGKVVPISLYGGSPSLPELGFPNTDIHRSGASLYRVAGTNIYRTKDGRYYHTHCSMNPEPTLTALKMPLEAPAEGEDLQTTAKRFQEVVGKIDSAELDHLMNEEFRQAGTICYTTEEFFTTEHGKANAHVGLYEMTKADANVASQPASWWPENSSLPSSPQRPLAGLKVVDLTRVIAAPVIGYSLAEMGASVMRVVSPHVTDMSLLHPSLNWGKWNCHLHLRNAEDREKLKQLILDADVVIEGYRPGVMAKYGLSRSDIFNLVKDRGRGIIHVKENCYGWNGPWQHRSGWQQISDAVCGVSLAYGKAMGHNEAVTPVFPNSDFCTGVIGSAAVLHALMRRAEEGGSYGVDVSLNYYSQWLVRSVGTYPPEVWQELWQRHDKLTFHNWHFMAHTIPTMLKNMREHDGERFFDPKFFGRFKSKVTGRTYVLVKPVAQIEGVTPGYNVGTRPNGVDAARWPDDLRTEIVT